MYVFTTNISLDTEAFGNLYKALSEIIKNDLVVLPSYMNMYIIDEKTGAVKKIK